MTPPCNRNALALVLTTEYMRPTMRNGAPAHGSAQHHTWEASSSSWRRQFQISSLSLRISTGANLPQQ